MQPIYQKNYLSIGRQSKPALSLTAVLILQILLLISVTVVTAQRKPVRNNRSPGGAGAKKRVSADLATLDEANNLFDRGDASSLAAALTKFQDARQLFQQSGDQKSEADAVVMIGRTYRKLNNPDEAFKQYAEAIALYRNINDKEGEGAALNNIGAYARDINQFSEAVKYFQAALPIERAVGNRNGEAKSLNGLGEAYGRLGQLQTAFDYLNQSLAIWRTLPLSEDHIRTLNNLAFVYSLSPDTKQQTISNYNEALDSARRLGSKLLQSDALIGLANAYDQAGEKSKAVETYNAAFTLSRQANPNVIPSARIDLISIALGDIYLRMGDRENAVKFLGAAEGSSNPISRLYAELSLGFLYVWAGDGAKANEYLSQGLSAAKQIGDKRATAISFCGLGNLAITNYQFSEAINYFNQALPLAGDFTVQSYALGGLMRANTLLGNQAGAQQAYEQTKNLTVNDGNFEGVFEISSAYALGQARFGAPQAAIQSFKTALLNAQKTGNKINEGRALIGLSAVLEKTGDGQGTLDNYRQALQIWEKLGNSLVEANILIGMGNQYYSQGQTQTANDNFNQALVIAKNINQPMIEAFALYNLGQTYLKNGDNAKALDYYNQAVPLFETVKNRQGLYQTLINISMIYDKTGDKKMAKEYRKKADEYKK